METAAIELDQDRASSNQLESQMNPYKPPRAHVGDAAPGGRLARFAFWAGLNLSLFLTAALATGAVFWATGRAGAVPCGEDAWRWGLLYWLVGFPALLSSYLVGFGAFVVLRKRLSAGKSLPIVLLVQLAVALMVLVIAVWPRVIYVAPACE